MLFCVTPDKQEGWFVFIYWNLIDLKKLETIDCVTL